MIQKTITVTGRGNISVKPDIMRVTLKISAIRPEYLDSYNLAQDYNRQIKDIVTKLGLDENLPKTSYFGIEKEMRKVYVNGHYDHEECVGYKLQQNVDIDLGIDNTLLGSLLHALGNWMTDVEVSLSYTVSDSRQAQYDIVEDATRDAKEKAARMVKALDCELGEVLGINYSWGKICLTREVDQEFTGCADYGTALSHSLDIEPEEIMASDDVTVIWAIKQ